MMPTDKLEAPFPYFGGKRQIADLVWSLFGKVDNYVEPFCGSLAMLLGAPSGRRIETVNDVNGFVVNFWRAIKSDPQSTAAWADWPVSEIDLEARHGWLVNRAKRLRWALQDPDYFDAKIAGWWVWGACAWIGNGWCLGKGPWVSNGANLIDSRQLPHVGDAGRGIYRQLPHVGGGGGGINRQLPHVSNVGRGEFIGEWFNSLSTRLRDVRVTCGDWSRVMTSAVTTKHGTTAVFFDPPYDSDVDRRLYIQHGSVSSDVRKWCKENQDDPKLRIVLAGYAEEHDLPGWSVLSCKPSSGGYGNMSGNQNYKRETLWASPQCEKQLHKQKKYLLPISTLNRKQPEKK